VLKHVRLLAFADDLKIFYLINSINDCLVLQDELNKMKKVSWADKLGLKFNTTKCHSMTFTHLKSPILFKYTIRGSVLKSIDNTVSDLGMVFFPTLSPNIHIERACCKAFKMLGFIKRVLVEFKLVTPLKALYCSLVRPILEYGSVVWDPNTANNSRMLERKQNTFLKYVSHVLMIDCPPHNHIPVLRHLNLDTLANRRRTINLNFLLKILNGQIESPSLLSLILFLLMSLPALPVNLSLLVFLYLQLIMV